MFLLLQDVVDYNLTYRNNAFHLAFRSSSVCSSEMLNDVKKNVRHRQNVRYSDDEQVGDINNVSDLHE